jgi:hypothetical protein
VAKRVLAETPASAALMRAASMEGAWKSMPMKVDLGYVWAIRTVDEPWPQPTSATFAPCASLSTTPSSAGSQASTRLAMYPGRKNRSVPQNVQL